MPADNITNNTYQQVLNLKEADKPLAHADHVVCALLPRGLYVAGFSSARELLGIHFTGYPRSKPVWQLDFFEHHFAHTPLLHHGDKVLGAFICSDKALLLPNALYEADAAKSWLAAIHHVEATDVTETYTLKDADASYLQAYPVHIAELIKISFKRARVLPLCIYQFNAEETKTPLLRCAITNEQVCATLYDAGRLLWHKVFHFAAAADIAFEVMLVCKEHNIQQDKVTVYCDTLCAGEYQVISGLSQYFSTIRDGAGNAITAQWAPAMSLAQQLFSCVL